MLRDAIMLLIGFGIGWIVLERPQLATDLWQWIKHKVHPDKSVL